MLLVVPKLVIQIALILIMIRCGYVGFQLMKPSRKNWLDILFYFSVAIVAFSFL